MFAYVSITPFGVPVEPEVNMIVATSSVFTLPKPSCISNNAAGSA